jgi:hypothetical protein
MELFDNVFQWMAHDYNSCNFDIFTVDSFGKFSLNFYTKISLLQLMLDGEIHQAGQYQELLVSSEAFRELVNAHKNTVSQQISS